MQKIKVANRWIGEKYPCFITVDIGANHNRDFGLAKKLIDKAKEADVDAVKFQFYTAELLYSKNTPAHSRYQKLPWDLIKEIETPREWVSKLREHCDKREIIFFATPFDLEAVDILAPYVDLYKIASFELTDLSLVKYIAAKKKPVIISTGLANMEEVKDAYLSCRESGNDKVIFLQCASSYPAKPEIINLKAMNVLGDVFPGVVVGLSDHTEGIHISVASVAMGAKVIEKHFTLSRKMNGPDHPFAIEPDELKEMVKQIRDVEAAIGSGRKCGPVPDEIENYNIGRRSIHARLNIPKGAKINKDMLFIKRPGFGIKPKFIDKLVGRKAKKNINTDSWITWEMVGG